MILRLKLFWSCEVLQFLTLCVHLSGRKASCLVNITALASHHSGTTHEVFKTNCGGRIGFTSPTVPRFFMASDAWALGRGLRWCDIKPVSSKLIALALLILVFFSPAVFIKHSSGPFHAKKKPVVTLLCTAS